MRVEMVKVNKVKVAISEEQKKLLTDQGYQILGEIPEAVDATAEKEVAEAENTAEPKKAGKAKAKKAEDSDGEDAGQK